MFIKYKIIDTFNNRQAGIFEITKIVCEIIEKDEYLKDVNDWFNKSKIIRSFRNKNKYKLIPYTKFDILKDFILLKSHVVYTVNFDDTSPIYFLSIKYGLFDCSVSLNTNYDLTSTANTFKIH